MKIKRMIMNFLVGGVLPVLWVIFLISTINSFLMADYGMAVVKTIFVLLFFVIILFLGKRVKEMGG